MRGGIFDVLNGIRTGDAQSPINVFPAPTNKAGVKPDRIQNLTIHKDVRCKHIAPWRLIALLCRDALRCCRLRGVEARFIRWTDILKAAPTCDERRLCMRFDGAKIV